MSEKAKRIGLFREEALADLETAAGGEVLEASRTNAGAWLCVGLVLLAIVIGIAVFGTVGKRARLPGFVANGGMALVNAPAAGVVRSRIANEGAFVKKGAPLIAIATDVKTERGEVAEQIGRRLSARSDELQSEVTRVKGEQVRMLDSLKTRKASLLSQIDMAESELAIAERAVVLQKEMLGREKKLVSDGFLSVGAPMQRETDLLNAEGGVVRLKRQLAQLKAGVTDIVLDEERVRGEKGNALMQLQQQIASVDVERAGNLAKQAVIVSSPSDGVVSYGDLQEGASISLGQSVATVAVEKGEKEVVAELYGASSSVGLIKVGQTVWVKYSSYPYQKYGMHEGVVSAISASPVAKSGLPRDRDGWLQSAAKTNEPMYRVSVRMKGVLMDGGNELALSAGMTLEAEVVNQRMKVWEFVFEPVVRAVARMRAN